MADETTATANAAAETATTEETNVTNEEATATSTTTEETERVTADDDWKTKSRKNETRAKTAEKRAEDAQKLADELAAKVKEYEDADKSEGEKLAEAKATAEKNAASAVSEAARLRVAIRKGLTEVQAKRLIGDTEAELEADADELLASFRPAEEPEEKPDPNRRPTEKLRPGAASSSEPEETDPRKLAARLPTDW